MLDKPIEKIEYDADGKVCGVTSGGETAKTKAVIADPSYFPDKVKKVGQVSIMELSNFTLFFTPLRPSRTERLCHPLTVVIDANASDIEIYSLDVNRSYRCVYIKRLCFQHSF